MAYHDDVLATTGLARFYRQTETSGTVAVDATGNQNGTYTGGPVLNQASTLPGSTDPSVLYDGVNDHILVANHAALDITTGAVSLEAWVTPSALPTTDNTWRTLIGKSDQYLVRVVRRAGSVRFEALARTATSTYVLVLGTTVPVVGSTYHVVMTKSAGSGTLRLYVNGVEENSAACGNIFSTTNPFYVARDGGSTNYFNGKVQAPAFYNVALDADTIADHWYSGSGTAPPPELATNHEDFGHSYCWGQGASVPAKAYSPLLAAHVNAPTHTNWGASGATIGQFGATPTTPSGATVDYESAYWAIRNFAVAHGGTPRQGLMTACHGLNDLSRGQAAAPSSTTFAEFETYLRALREAGGWDSSDAIVTAGTGWSTTVATDRNSGSSYVEATSLPSGNITIAIPAGFPGGDIVLRFIGRDNSTTPAGGTLDILLDGASHGTHDCRGAIGTFPRFRRSCYRLASVAPGAHSIVLDPVSFQGAFMGFDRVAYETTASPRLLVWHAARLPSGGYAAHGGGLYGDADVNAWNALLDTLPGRFMVGSMVVVGVPSMHNAAGYFNADLIHPNDTGHAYLANQAAAGLAAVTTTSTVTAVASVTASVKRGATGVSVVNAVAQATTAARKTVQASSSVAGVATVTAATAKGGRATSEVVAQATVTGAATRTASAASTVAAVATAATTGHKAATSPSTVDAVAQATAAATRGARATSTVTDVATVTATIAGGAATSLVVTTATVTATGFKHAQASSSVAAVAAVMTIGGRSVQATSSVTAVASAVTAGHKAAASPATVTATGQVTASGTKGVSASSAAAASAALAAFGSKATASASTVTTVGAVAATGVHHAFRASLVTTTATVTTARGSGLVAYVAISSVRPAAVAHSTPRPAVVQRDPRPTIAVT